MDRIRFEKARTRITRACVTIFLIMFAAWLKKKWMNGNDFDSSYSMIMDSIGNDRLREIEHQTLLLLDKKFQKMKQFTYIIGLISAFLILFGSLSKRMHWPGAGIELTLGL